MGERVGSWIDHHGARTPDRLALVDLATRRERSYGEVSDRVRALAARLSVELGVGRGNRVAVLSRRVVTADGTPAGPGETGELLITGRVVTPGYWSKPEQTRAAFTGDGWLRTGDAARIDADGFLTLVDRWKDMYISGGENVYPAEVENVIYTHPGVVQAAVVGVPDQRWDETGVAFVVPGRGSALNSEDVRGWCAQRIAGYKVPSRVVLVDDLPRNATGKVLKAPLRQRAVE